MIQPSLRVSKKDDNKRTSFKCKDKNVSQQSSTSKQKKNQLKTIAN